MLGHKKRVVIREGLFIFPRVTEVVDMTYIQRLGDRQWLLTCTYFAGIRLFKWKSSFQGFSSTFIGIQVLSKIYVIQFKMLFDFCNHELLPLNVHIFVLKAYRLSKLFFFIFIKSCQYSMFYTDCSSIFHNIIRK
jgi:hypothetical protein